jgi:hypothetical protein
MPCGFGYGTVCGIEPLDGLGFCRVRSAFTPVLSPGCYILAIVPPKTPACDPGFLGLAFRVTNYEGYTFTGADINFAARAIFAETSSDVKEQIAAANVVYNRVDNKGFKTKGRVEQTLTAVVEAPHQFNAVTSPGPNRKFLSSADGSYQNLTPADCASLATAITAMTSIATGGTTADYTFFAAAWSTTNGVLIGATRFW